MVKKEDIANFKVWMITGVLGGVVAILTVILGVVL